MEVSGYILSAGLELFFALISVVLLIGCLLDSERKRNTNRIMISILVVNAVMNVIDACIWIWCDAPELLVLMKIFSFLSYALGCGIFVLFSLLLITFIRENTFVSKWIDRGVLMLAAIMAVLWIISIFNGMYYYWDENGICQYGDYFWLSQAFGALFCFIDIALTICYRKALGKKGCAVFILYSIVPLLSFIAVFYWDVTPLYMAFTVVLLLYYIIIHVEHGQRIVEQENKLIKQELELTNSRTAIVLSQIRPHFLYNSLTAIAQLCEKDPKKAKETTLNFSDYLRINMSSLDQRELISFKKELEHVQKYLAIEQVRFGEDLCVDFDIEADDFYLPALSLQPIVENAVKHGVGMKEEGGTVSVSSGENGDFFEVTVSDDGVGFDKSRDVFDDKKHLGMRLVRTRLDKLVGGTMNVESRPGIGTTVTMRIPKKKAE